MNFRQRLNQVRKLLNKLGCEILIVDNPTNIFYLSGIAVSVGKILISQKQACLVVDGRYFERCQTQNLYSVLSSDKFLLKDWLSSYDYKQVGFESHFLTHEGYLKLAESFRDTHLHLVPTASPIEKLRMLKDEDEIQILKQAAKLDIEGFNYVSSLLKEGISEEAMGLELEIFWKRKGSKRLSFDPIIAFGKNSSMPHYRAGPDVFSGNQHVLIDIGVEWKHYHSDLTRVLLPLNPQKEIFKIYDVVQEAKNKAVEICRPGTLVGDLDKIARAYIASKGYGEFFTHSLGHGVGLDIHERPIIRSTGIDAELVLQKGMVITIEPGVYLPNLGGVRLEDTLLITEKGCEILTV